MPEDVGWANELVEQVCAFTGVKDAADDIVDALAALGNLFGARAVGEVLGMNELMNRPRPDTVNVETIHVNRARSIG